MLTPSTRLSTVIVACAGLLLAADRAMGQTATTATTTTTSTTTTTTLLPHPFSPATRGCIHQARADLRKCRRGGGGDDCVTAFQAAYPKCFATGSGVSCAKRCVSRKSSCLTAAPATKKTCRKACLKTRRADVRACRRIADGDDLWAGGDASCLTTAQANLDLCRIVCDEARLDCRIAFRFCTANCPNL